MVIAKNYTNKEESDKEILTKDGRFVETKKRRGKISRTYFPNFFYAISTIWLIGLTAFVAYNFQQNVLLQSRIAQLENDLRQPVKFLFSTSKITEIKTYNIYRYICKYRYV